CGLAVSVSSAFHPAASVSGDCADFCDRGFRIRRSLTYSCSLLRCRFVHFSCYSAQNF
ncbi:hypothetical protein BHE74_00044885, partial [Ensete ventricosum]